MAYLIGPDESADKGVRRVLREQNARIHSLLSRWESDPVHSIHAARQACKRARAVAQLLKSAMPYAAGVENRFFRDIQKQLAHVRDLEARVEAIDYLAIGVREPPLAESVAFLRDYLAARSAQDLEGSRLQLRAQIEVTCRELRTADRRLARLPCADLRRRELRRGADQTWERCVASFEALGPGSPASAYHAWRRQVKYAAHQTQLLAGLTPIRATIAGPRLRHLSAQLGHCQDLEILDTMLRQPPDTLAMDTRVQQVRQLIADSLARLHRLVLETGVDLFKAVGEPLNDPAQRAAVTEAQHSRKGAAINSAQDPSSPKRTVLPDRDPHSPRGRQPG